MKKPATARAARPNGRAAAPKPKGFDRGAFYRLCRMLHAYFSAFAFLTLIFFAGTGLMLNHPDWIPAKPAEVEKKLTVPAMALEAAQRAADPSKALAASVAEMTPLMGAYRSGDVADDQANLRFEGAKGSSTVLVDLKTGAADVTVERAGMLATIGDLHRGKNAGKTWALLIDASAILVLILSVIGYVLFFSLRFRLKTSLILTAASLAVMIGVYVFATA